MNCWTGVESRINEELWLAYNLQPTTLLVSVFPLWKQRRMFLQAEEGICCLGFINT